MADDLNGIDKNTEYSADTFVNERIVINTIFDLEEIIK